MTTDLKFGKAALPIINQNSTVIKQAVVLEVVDNAAQFKDDNFLDAFSLK